MSTHNIPFSISKRKSPLIIPKLLLLNFFPGTQERDRNSATVVLLCNINNEKYLKNKDKRRSDPWDFLL